MLSKFGFNRYDYFIIIIIASVVFGVIGGAFQPVRVLSIVLIPFTFVRLNILYAERKTRPILIFLIFWYCYSLMSFFWTSNTDEAIKELFYYIVHMNLFLALILCSMYANKPLIAIIFGWSLFTLLTIPIAFNEIFNDVHLPVSILGSDVRVNIQGEIMLKKYASVSFGNYNGYVTNLCFALPFVFSLLFFARKRSIQIFVWASVLSISYILITNASRGGVISLGIMFVLFLWFFMRKEGVSRPFFLFSIIGVLLAVIINYKDVVFEQFLFRTIERDSIFEDTTRMQLINIGLQILMDSFFFGTGIGSLITTFSQRTDGITIPHNLMIELLVQFGLLISIIVLIYFYNLFVYGYRSKTPQIKFILYTAIFSFPFVSVINSGYLLMPSLWLYFASLTVFSIFWNENFIPEYYD